MPPRQQPERRAIIPPQQPLSLQQRAPGVRPGLPDDSYPIYQEAGPELGRPPAHEKNPSNHTVTRGVGRLLFGGKIRRRITAGVLVMTTGYSGFAMYEQDPPADGYGTCIDGGHDLIKLGNTSSFLGINALSKDALRGSLNTLSFGHFESDNRTWDDLAKTETSRWVYKETGAALAQANPDLATYSPDGTLQQTIGRAGTFCIARAAPEIKDEEVVDGKHTVEDYWSNHAEADLTLKDFYKLNPGLSGDKNQVLEAGKSLVFSKHPDTSLVMRRMTEQSLGQLTNDNAKMIADLNHSQPANIAIKHNEDAFLPYDKQSSYMENHGITNAQVQAQFADSYKNLGYSQVPAPKHVKPTTNPPKSTTNPEKSINPEYTIDPGNLGNLATQLAAAAKLEALGGEWKNVGMFYDFFLRKGMPAVGISGLTSNCKGESTCNSRRVQGDRPDSDMLPPGIGDALGYGWMQWTSLGRQQHLQRVAQRMHLQDGDERVQLQLIWEELNSGTYKHVLNSLMQPNLTPQQASDIVLGPHQVGDLLKDGYENPVAATAHKYRRREFAVNDYAMFTQQVAEVS